MSIQETKQTIATRKAVEKEREVITKAFGGCLKCYGKGYSTQKMKKGMNYLTCVCDRGKQIDEMMKYIEIGFITYARGVLPTFVETEYPKGKSKERGIATVACAQLLTWLRKQI